ncbi:MAG TPA: aryl-sulfate sulfotransferase, partial [Polyangiaceae bacterium]
TPDSGGSVEATGGGGTPGSGGGGAAAAGIAGVAGSGGSGGVGATGGSGATAGAGGDIATGGSAYDVAIDPYGTNPLVAVVNLRGIDASDVERIEVVVTGQDGAPDFAKAYAPADAELVENLDTSDLDFPESGYHVPVYGLYADRENDVRIHVDRSGAGPVELMLPIVTSLARPGEDAWVPGITVNAAAPEQMEPGWTVAEISIEANPNPPIVFVEWTRYLAYDERGAIRWALRFDDLPKGETFTLRRSISGNFLTGSLDTLIEVTKLGRVTRTSRLSEHTLHHELLEIGGDDNGQGVSGATTSEYAGNLLVLASKNGASTIQDHILEVDPASGAVKNDWDLAQVLDPTRTTFIDPEEWAPGAGDWLHENGLAYSAADESIIVSGRHQGVAKIRRDGSLVWLLAPRRGWNEPQLGKLLTAVDTSGTAYEDSVQMGDAAAGDAAAPEFDWPFGQHSPVLLSSGDLLVFDNGTSRHFGPPYASYSRAVIYRIDEAALTVRQLGQFILTRRESSYFVSNTAQLPATGNIFVQPGGSAQSPAVFKELATRVADDGTVSFDGVVFDAALDLSWADSSRWFVYSFRGHRWTF